MSESDPKPVRRPRPKYQVFISSTKKDLHEEREAVTWEILKAGHIPAGMENFTATDDRGWQTIQRTIDRSDYYVVLVAGLYGTEDPSTGMSWTQREYEYAKKKMPVLAFIREDKDSPGHMIETDAVKRAKLDEFKKVLNDSHHREQWSTKAELPGKVVLALTTHIQNDEDDGKARPGWFRGDEVPVSPAALEEFARLSAENLELRQRVAEGAEALELRDGDGKPLEDSTVEASRIRVRRDDAVVFHPLLSGPSLAEAQAYAFKKAITAWFDLRVVNTGTRPARNIVADFSVVNVDGVFLHEPDEPPVGPLNLPPIRVKQFYDDPNEYVYVESSSVKNGRAKVRQRVRLIAAGGSESLISMGFPASLSSHSDEEVPVILEYEVRSESGVTARGKVTTTVRVRGETVLSLKEALGEDDE